MATWVIYSQFKQAAMVNLNNANLAAAGDTIKVMLANSTYTPAANTDQFASTPRTYEVANGNGAAGTYFTTNANNLQFTNKTCTLTSNVVTFTSSNSNTINWSQDAANAFSARYVILYKATGTDATSPLICYADLGSNQTNSAGSLTLQLDVNGVFTLT